MKQSAGILLYRHEHNQTEFFLAHPGGPFFKNKNEGVWTIPKGEINEGEEPLNAAVREFEEEIGYTPFPPFTELQPITQKGGKKVLAWAAKGDADPAALKSNIFIMEWPPKSGKMAEFPEVDKAGWFNLEEAKKLINPAQVHLLEELLKILNQHT